MTEENTSVSDVAAEQVVIGSILITDTAMESLIDSLSPEHFYSPLNQYIYRVMMRRFSEGLPLDPISISGDLISNRSFINSGGAAYLHTCMSVVPVSANAGYFASLIQKKATRRNLLVVANRIGQMVRDPDMDEDSMVDKAGSLVHELHPGAMLSANPMANVTSDAIKRLRNPEVVTRQVGLGLRDLDQVIGPIRPGNLVVVGARPGIGKTVSLIQAARKAAFYEGKSVLSFSLEMTSEEWALRILAAEASVSNIMRGHISDDDLERLDRAQERVIESRYGIVDKPAITIPEILIHCRRHKRTYGELDLVTVDYLQLVGTTGGNVRQEQVAQISSGFKVAAKELDATILLAVQLNRGPEGRADKRPLLSDIRESGAVEQDADIVILLYRPDFYDPMERPNEIDFIVAKHRHGQSGSIVTANSQLHLSRFRSFSVQPAS